MDCAQASSCLQHDITEPVFHLSLKSPCGSADVGIVLIANGSGGVERTMSNGASYIDVCRWKLR